MIAAVSRYPRKVLLVLLMSLIMMIIGAPAAFASSSNSASPNVVPYAWHGTVCRAVSSGPTHGSICIILNTSDVTGAIQALVRFNSASGDIAYITDTGLVLNALGLNNPVRDNGYQAEPVGNSTNAYFSTGWYFPPYLRYWWADVKNPCILWKTGRIACVSGWLQSQEWYDA